MSKNDRRMGELIVRVTAPLVARIADLEARVETLEGSSDQDVAQRKKLRGGEIAKEIAENIRVMQQQWRDEDEAKTK